MPAIVHLLPANEYRRERWRNGQGWTREILRVPEAEDFIWRASIAEISQDTLFSAYPGYRRSQVLLLGDALRLGFSDGRRVTLEAPHQRLEFDGTEVVACHLPAGPVQVFNLMWDPQRLDARLLHRPLVGPMVFLPEQGVRWLVHLMAGHARLRAQGTLALSAGDSLLLEPMPGDRLVLEGSGEALVLRLATRADPASPSSDPSRNAPQTEPPAPDPRTPPDPASPAPSEPDPA